MRRWIATVFALALVVAVALPVEAHGPAALGWARTARLIPAGSSVTVTGTLRLYHIDDFADDVGADGYAVETSAGFIPLDVRGTAPEALNGARVQVRGTWHDGVVRVGVARDATAIAKLSPAPRRRIAAVLGADGQSVHLADGAPLAATSKNVAVILFGFSDDASQPYTAGTATQIAFTNGNAVANYYDEESRGAVTVTGQVFGWYQIPSSKATCDPFTWATQAKAAATAAGVNLAAFTNYVYAFPKANSCGWAGLGAMPGKDSWNNGAFALRVVAHELGHNFGVHHASSLSCTSGASRVAISSTCSSSEYGDPFSVMGSGNSAHNNAVHLGQFGWLPASEIQTVGPGGPYELGSPLDGPAGSDRLLRIDRHNGTSLYLDVRSIHGPYFDNFSSTDAVVKGVTVRISPDLPSPGYGLSQTQLVDTTPATSTYADAPLAVGATLTDPVTGLKVTTLSASGGRRDDQHPRPDRPGRAGQPEGHGDERHQHLADLDEGQRQLRGRPLSDPARRRRGGDPDRTELRRRRSIAADDLRLPDHRGRRLGQRGPGGRRERQDAAVGHRRHATDRGQDAQGVGRQDDDQAVLDRRLRRLRGSRLQGLPGRRDGPDQDRDHGQVGDRQAPERRELLRAGVRRRRQPGSEEPEPQDLTAPPGRAQ